MLIGLGANLPSRFGSPAETIHAALSALSAAGLKVVKSSRLWLTAPVPPSDQPWYHNAVAEIETSLDPAGVLGILQSIEADFGRARITRNEARILDLDLLASGGTVMEDPLLTLPHPRMHERVFVLLPLQDIDPHWRHPVTGQTLAALIAALPADQKGMPL